jgi:hypothetical protein
MLIGFNAIAVCDSMTAAGGTPEFFGYIWISH